MPQALAQQLPACPKRRCALRHRSLALRAGVVEVAGANPAHRVLPVVSGQMVDEENPVEVVELMEEHSSVESFSLDRDRGTVDVIAPQLRPQRTRRRIEE